eukprot:scaffold4516_cov417-Prasinococcus_capsulatus_cf.AAC.24
MSVDRASCRYDPMVLLGLESRRCRVTITPGRQVPIQGWFAQKDQFEMGRDFERASDIRGFQIATPSIISMRCIQVGGLDLSRRLLSIQSA